MPTNSTQSSRASSVSMSSNEILIMGAWQTKIMTLQARIECLQRHSAIPRGQDEHHGQPAAERVRSESDSDSDHEDILESLYKGEAAPFEAEVDRLQERREQTGYYKNAYANKKFFHPISRFIGPEEARKMLTEILDTKLETNKIIETQKEVVMGFLKSVEQKESEDKTHMDKEILKLQDLHVWSTKVKANIDLCVLVILGEHLWIGYGTGYGDKE